MKLEVGKVYRLEGWIFNQEINTTFLEFTHPMSSKPSDE